MTAGAPPAPPALQAEEYPAYSIRRALPALLADIPYERGKPVEAYFRNLLFIVFRLVGFYREGEHPLAGGRSDTVVKTDKYISVLELKVDESVEAALAQIEEIKYAERWKRRNRKRLLRIIPFSGLPSSSWATGCEPGASAFSTL